ncbi:alpha/beta hydrolase-fold protein [Rothia sp. ARF10]|nr:alpha/beta hydrolase-fold protein [Rothia sp. ARF10]
MPQAEVLLPVPGHDARLRVVRHGHWGRPLLAFPSEGGDAGDFEANGMLDAVRHLVDAGRVSIFAVDSMDGFTWSDNTVPTDERAARHGGYQAWLDESVIPWIAGETGGTLDLITFGVSLGAYHAVQFALQRADVATLAMGFSGNYDPTTWNSWGDLGDATYFANPAAYVPNLHGDHLEWLRSRLSVLLVVGEGPFEVSPTRALPQTRAFAEVLGDKGIRHELDVWGHDSAHDWPWWRRQLAHHLPRFV